MSVIVEVQQGKLKGKENTSTLSGKKYFTFSGIPYGKPPIGDLRFRAPEPAEKWQGIYDATYEKNVCMQKDEFLKGDITGSEDCLFLNINTPEEPGSIETPKAVMVFIHGGAFFFGSGSERWYSADYLIDQDVVVVTLNYRLHALGFLNLGIPDCPGNAGLKDQVLALKWIQENIKQFGGDANNVTVFGESAGATSVHFLTISPAAKGLFHKAIIQSGSVLVPWALSYNYEDIAKEVGRKLNFPGGSAFELLDFLKKQDASELTRVGYELRLELVDRYPGRASAVPFGPSVEVVEEGAFLPDTPENLLKTATPMPIIYGATDKEGILVCKLTSADTADKLKTDFSIVLKNNFKIDPILVPELSDKIKKYYFGDKDIEVGEELFELYTDLFFYRFHEGIENLTKSSTPPFVYEFSFDGNLNIYKKLIAGDVYPDAKGACHADEIPYLFSLKVLPNALPLIGDELTVIQNMTSLWANFAKIGVPKKDLWKPSTSSQPCYLRIDRELSLVEGKVYGKRLQFLKDLLDPVIESFNIF